VTDDESATSTSSSDRIRRFDDVHPAGAVDDQLMSSTAPTVTWEPDAPPLVRVIGASLRRAAVRPGAAERMRRLQGRVVVRSTVGPQAATVGFDRGLVHVMSGVAADADVVISGDLDESGRPGSPKPKVAGAVRHPLLAVGAGRLLDAAPPGGWIGAVNELWTWAKGDGRRPALLRVVCTDDGDEHVVGAAGSTLLEVHGPAWALQAVFAGVDHLGGAVVEGRVQVVADFAVLTKFIGLLTRFMLGVARGPSDDH
jgi:hypothetical protein